ncbi:MAG: hypothetical protein SGARI_006028 [Bacillariaceae sp.]
MWSIGVIAYILLCGFAPFAGDTDYDTLQLVARAPLEFPSPEWDDISDEARDFVTKLLNRDPVQRPTADQALKHPWISKHVRSVSEQDRSSFYATESEKRSAFHKFLANIKVNKALKTVNQCMTPNEAKFLGNVFHKIDKDNDGKIRAKDIDAAVETGHFSDSVAGNLAKMRSIMGSATKEHHPTFDIRPFLESMRESPGDGDNETKRSKSAAY